jgi:hypothetical protein
VVSTESKFWWVCFCIAKILDWELLGTIEENPFEIAFRQHFPELHGEACKIVVWIKQLGGYVTIANVEQIYKKIISDYEMENMLYV